MGQMTARRKDFAWVIPCLSALVFLLTGLALLPYPGLQSDEVVFWQVLTRQQMACYSFRFGTHFIPLLQLSYAGPVKAFLYWPLFQIFPPNVWLIRVPTLLFGMLTIWLTWCWMKRLAGVGAAVVTTVLLSTDTLFLLTDAFDWGPVALQHVFLLGGLLALQRWIQDSSGRIFLALGFFLWGVGLWDKALLIWPLIGLAAGVVCVFPGQVFVRLRPLPIVIAAVSLLLGAAPLVLYNLQRKAPTVSQNVHFETGTFVTKARLLGRTFDGSGLMGSLSYGDWDGAMARPPRNVLERTAVRIAHLLPRHRKNWMPYAYILALCCLILLWRSPVRRPLLFLLITVAVEWASMATTKAAGYYPHHTILLWPFPLAFLGIAFSEVAKRSQVWGWPVLAIVVAVLSIGNLITTDRYLTDFISNGEPRDWTDAIYPLVASFQNNSVERIGAVEWGYLWQIQMMTSSNVKRDCRDYFLDVSSPIVGACSPVGDPASAKEFGNFITSPDAVFIQHTPGKELTPGVNQRFRAAISKLGYREELERIVADSNGRPIFEVFHIRR